MKNNRRKWSIGVGICIVLLTCVLTGSVYASPSIRDLHGNELNTIIRDVDLDGTNTGRILSQEYIYTNEAIKEQYMKEDENGVLQPTALSILIEDGHETITDTGANGIAIPEDISTVKEMVDTYIENAKLENPNEPPVPLEDLDQLTYWLDFKHEVTDYRVLAGSEHEYKKQSVVLDNGAIEVEIEGGEITRSSDPESFVIIQINAVEGDIYYLNMKEYDYKTGKYVVEFPCIGPYIISQIMK